MKRANKAPKQQPSPALRSLAGSEVALRACLNIPLGPVFAQRAGWLGARREDTRQRSLTDEQRRQPALCAKTLRAAALLPLAFVGSTLTARCGDARVSTPRPAPKSLAAGPIAIFRQALSSRKRWIFRIVAACVLPVLLLGVLEAGLRFLHYGYPTQLFLPYQRNETNEMLVTNDRFGFRFFPASIARSPTPNAFPKNKALGTYRIILFGESAALGDPRPAYGVGRYLQVLLNERFAPRRFEVIPAAMTAINSQVVLEMARERRPEDARRQFEAVLRLEPDNARARAHLEALQSMPNPPSPSPKERLETD